MHKGNVGEDFLTFIDWHNENYVENIKIEPVLSGKVIAETVTKKIMDLGLELSYCVGISTDGCSVMTSETKGVVIILQKTFKNATYCPCYNHALILSISKSSNTKPIQNAVGVMKEVVQFFNSSSKRSKIIEHFSNNQKLKSICETRWVERHESVLRFKMNCSEIVNALENISQWQDTEASNKASLLLNSLMTTNFIVSLCVLSDLLGASQALSTILQKKSLYKDTAENLVKTLKSLLNKKRENAEKYFKPIFISNS